MISNGKQYLTGSQYLIDIKVCSTYTSSNKEEVLFGFY